DVAARTTRHAPETRAPATGCQTATTEAASTAIAATTTAHRRAGVLPGPMRESSSLSPTIVSTRKAAMAGNARTTTRSTRRAPTATSQATDPRASTTR